MAVNPFDLKSPLLAKHAQHVVLVHFLIALFISSFVFDLLAIRTGSRSLAKAAYYNLIGAAITAPAAVATGVLAWQLQLEGREASGQSALTSRPRRLRGCADLVAHVVANMPSASG
jgi:uncharacterized membrane protein